MKRVGLAVPAARRAPSWMPWAIAGTGLGILSALSPGGMFLLFLAVLVALLLYRFTDSEHRRFLVALFLVAFAVRVLFSLGLDAGARLAEGRWASRHGAPHDWDLGIAYRMREYMRMGDSDYLFQRGYASAHLARGVREPVVVYRAQQSYGWNGYADVLGAFCYLFGFSPSAATFINCLLGALLGPAVFFLTRACYAEGAVARWAALAVAGFPSLILWSATNLKEPSLHVLTVWLLWLFLKIQQAGSWRSRLGLGVCIGGALAVHATLRSAAYTWALAACSLAGWAIAQCLRRRWYPALLGGLLGLGVMASHLPLRALLAASFHVHLGHLWAPGMCYQYLPQAFYTPGYEGEWLRSGHLDWRVAVWVMKAVGHFLVEPLPWRNDNVFFLLAYPQMLVWYYLLPLAGIGVLSAIRWNLHRTLGLLFTLAAWTLVGGLTNGNSGTVFRMRDMVTPLILVFVSAGAWRCAYGKQPRAALQVRDARPVSGAP